MFTGIIQSLGEVKGIRPERGSVNLVIQARDGFQDLVLGESIAVDGACLTVTKSTRSSFHALASPETLSRTTLSELRSGSMVNLERALMPTDRLGGHFVLGHVDCTGTLSARDPDGQALRLRFDTPAEALPLIVSKGSIAVDGVSLTVNEVGADSFTVLIIPFTASYTTLVRKAVGARVNLETDILAKHLLRIVGALLPGSTETTSTRTGSKLGSIDLDFLARHGFLK